MALTYSNTRPVDISKDSVHALILLILRYLHNLLLVKRLWYSYHYIPCKKKIYPLHNQFIDQDVNSKELYCHIIYVALVFYLT